MNEEAWTITYYWYKIFLCVFIQQMCEHQLCARHYSRSLPQRAYTLIMDSQDKYGLDSLYGGKALVLHVANPGWCNTWESIKEQALSIAKCSAKTNKSKLIACWKMVQCRDKSKSEKWNKKHWMKDEWALYLWLRPYWGETWVALWFDRELNCFLKPTELIT